MILGMSLSAFTTLHVVISLMGIVSGLGRRGLNLNTYENFIQTDASINVGNSGGALIDTAGNLIGINTAIFSRTGGSVGIGFAIPVSTAKAVLEQIVQQGGVTRGYIGVQTQGVSSEVVEPFKSAKTSGVLIAGVERDGVVRGLVERREVRVGLDARVTEVGVVGVLAAVEVLVDARAREPVEARDGLLERLRVEVALLGELPERVGALAHAIDGFKGGVVQRDHALARFVLARSDVNDALLRIEVFPPHVLHFHAAHRSVCRKNGGAVHVLPFRVRFRRLEESSLFLIRQHSANWLAT